jgi:hypothetical protein
MEQKIEKGIGWLERLLKMEEKYGFFRFLRVLLLLLLTGFVILIITNPRYVLDKVESIQTEQHDESVIKRIQADADIRLILHHLLHTLNADRAWLIELHNGAKNLTSGLPFLYGDMRIEVVADGISNVDDEYINFQLSKYPFIGKLFDDGFYWGSVDAIRETDERMYFKFKSNSVNEIAIIALYTGEKPLGVIGVSFCNDKHMDAVAVGKSIRKCGIQVATLLSN